MSENRKAPLTLADGDMVTTRKLSRRTLLAGAAIGGAALAAGGRSVLAADKGDKPEKDKGEKDKGDQSGKDKSKIETTRDKD